MNVALFIKYRYLINIAAIYLMLLHFDCYRIFWSVLAAIHFTLTK